MATSQKVPRRRQARPHGRTAEDRRLYVEEYLPAKRALVRRIFGKGQRSLFAEELAPPAPRRSGRRR